MAARKCKCERHASAIMSVCIIFPRAPLCEHRSEGKSQTSLPSSNTATPPHPRSPSHPEPGTQRDGTMKQGERDNRKQNLKVDFRANQLWWMWTNGNLSMPNLFLETSLYVYDIYMKLWGNVDLLFSEWHLMWKMGSNANRSHDSQVSQSAVSNNNGLHTN